MKIEIILPDKFEGPLKDVVSALQPLNPDTELTNEKVLSNACKMFIIQEHAKYLDVEDVEEAPK